MIYFFDSFIADVYGNALLITTHTRKLKKLPHNPAINRPTSSSSKNLNQPSILPISAKSDFQMILDDNDSTIDALIKSQHINSIPRKLSPVTNSSISIPSSPIHENLASSTNTSLSGTTKSRGSKRNVVPKEKELDIYRKCIHQLSQITGNLFYLFNLLI